MKLKSVYICQSCGYEHSKWSGKCLSCGSWGGLIEDVVEKGNNLTTQKIETTGLSVTLQNLSEVLANTQKRLHTEISEFDRTLGGGIVEDSITLLTGDPGIGKSTLALQIALQIANQNKKVLYISGEESMQQVAMRAKRLQKGKEGNIFFINEIVLERIIATIKTEKPDLVVVDSVQVVASNELGSVAGTMNQIRYIAEQMMILAKKEKIPVVLIGHVTKDGVMAGPMVLSHLVDTVLYLEGQKNNQFRLLRATKNRFGATSEVGVFEMKEEGLRGVENPSAAFLEGRGENALGSVVTCTLQGSRPFLVEIQALTSYTKFGYPKRTASGIDLNRLNLMIAVLNKYTKMGLDSQDVFVNVVGGFKINDPGIDLAVCMAIASSKLKKPLGNQFAAFGEVGLSGELRNVNFVENRFSEIKKMGIKQGMFPKIKKSIDRKDGYMYFSTISEVIKNTML